MNKVVLVGNLATDVDYRTVGDNVGCARFTLAVNRRYAAKDGQRETDFIKVVAWRALADLCARYIGKGKRVGVVGSLQIRSYDDKEGNKRYLAEVVADEIEFLSPAGQQEGTNAAGGFVETYDEDMPF